jgi:hypothetical protein
MEDVLNQVQNSNTPIPEEENYDKYTKSAGWVETARRNDINYKTRIRLQSKYKVHEDFKNGNQWPAPTKDTKDYPRPVFNVIRFIEDHKVNSVKNSTIKIVYNNPEGDIPEMGLQDADKVNDLATKYTHFAANEWERMKMEKVTTKALHTACNKGITALHFPWNPKIKGGRKLKWIGAMDVEEINGLNISFGNPQCLEVEPQPYIVIYTRESVKKVKKRALDNGIEASIVSQIVADKDTMDRVFDNAQIEMDDVEGEGKVNVLTVYFKVTLPVTKVDPATNEQYEEEKEFVFFQKYASGIVFQKATNTLLSRYPIAIMNWYEVEECIFGQGEPEGIINNQRIINLIIACMTKSVENTGFPKLKYKSGTINPATLNNNIGGMIEIIGQSADMNSVDFLNPGPVTPLAQNLVEIYMQYTKNMTGATETSTGELNQGDAMNASAIALLQKAASIPIDGIRDKYYQFIEDIALIFMDYFRTKYNTARLVNYKDEMNKEQTMVFRGTDGADIDFTPRIDIGPSTNYSEMLVVKTLEDFVAAGYMSFDQLLKYAPTNYIPYKEQLIKEREMQAKQAMDEENEMMAMDLNPVEREAISQAPPEQQQEIFRKMRLRKKMMEQQAANNPDQADKGIKTPVMSGMMGNQSGMMG